MSSINKAILIGNLGQDPELKTTSSSKHVATFSLATSESWKDKATGERKSETQWHNIVVWGNLAEIAGKYLKKGSKVYIEGKIKTRGYDSNGQKKYITEIVADSLTMLGEKPQADHIITVDTDAMHAASKIGGTDDLPF